MSPWFREPRGYVPGPLLWKIWSQRTTMMNSEFGDSFVLLARRIWESVDGSAGSGSESGTDFICDSYSRGVQGDLSTGRLLCSWQGSVRSKQVFALPCPWFSTLWGSFTITCRLRGPGLSLPIGAEPKNPRVESLTRFLPGQVLSHQSNYSIHARPRLR